MIDSRSTADLHPAVERAAKELIARMKGIGYNVLITSTYRDFEKQNALYAQGRTTSGNIVTNAKGGQSVHNYRLAFDICKNVKGGEYSDAAFFNQAGKIGTSLGLVWGGNWKNFVDKPHFEFTNGLTIAQLQQGRNVAADYKFDWEIKKEAEYMLTKAKISVDDNTVCEVDSILKDGHNFVNLREFAKAGGFDVEYSENTKVIYINKNKKTD